MRSPETTPDAELRRPYRGGVRAGAWSPALRCRGHALVRAFSAPLRSVVTGVRRDTRQSPPQLGRAIHTVGPAATGTRGQQKEKKEHALDT